MTGFEIVEGLSAGHVGKVVSVTCKPMAGYHRISAVGVLKGFTYMDGLTVYLEGVKGGICFPMVHSGMKILVKRDCSGMADESLTCG